MPTYASQNPIGGSIFNYGESTGVGPIYENPGVGPGTGTQSFGGLWVVVLIMAAIAFLIFFVMK